MKLTLVLFVTVCIFIAANCIPFEYQSDYVQDDYASEYDTESEIEARLHSEGESGDQQSESTVHSDDYAYDSIESTEPPIESAEQSDDYAYGSAEYAEPPTESAVQSELDPRFGEDEVPDFLDRSSGDERMMINVCNAPVAVTGDPSQYPCTKLVTGWWYDYELEKCFRDSILVATCDKDDKTIMDLTTCIQLCH